MTKVIDLRLDVPLSADEIAEMIKYFVLSEDKSGIANYVRIFGPQWETSLGFSFEELEKKATALSGDELDDLLMKVAGKMVVTPEQFKRQLDEAGIEWGLVDAHDHEKTAKLVTALPDRLKGIAMFNPFKGVSGVEEVERVVKDQGFAAIFASPYRWGIKADDIFNTLRKKRTSIDEQQGIFILHDIDSSPERIILMRNTVIQSLAY